MSLEDHPRIRGTNIWLLHHPKKQIGSSPHTRDKQTLNDWSHIQNRIIPAYAGQTAFGFSTPTTTRDHPRIRGTNYIIIPYPAILPGSSPHTRDKHLGQMWKKLHLGIIPAYAGQTMQKDRFLPVLQDHPRIRGTNYTHNTGTSVRAGSSPHTRDKLFLIML